MNVILCTLILNVSISLYLFFTVLSIEITGYRGVFVVFLNSLCQSYLKQSWDLFISLQMLFVRLRFSSFLVVSLPSSRNTIKMNRRNQGNARTSTVRYKDHTLVQRTKVSLILLILYIFFLFLWYFSLYKTKDFNSLIL